MSYFVVEALCLDNAACSLNCLFCNLLLLAPSHFSLVWWICNKNRWDWNYLLTVDRVLSQKDKITLEPASQLARFCFRVCRPLFFFLTDKSSQRYPRYRLHIQRSKILFEIPLCACFRPMLGSLVGFGAMFRICCARMRPYRTCII